MEGRSSAAELDDWRTQCWTYLDSKGEGTKLANPETIALRAVLCVLYTETPDAESLADATHWFVMLLLRRGKAADEILAELNMPDQASPARPALQRIRNNEGD
jgi:hypothetical protein